jgi:DNA mismatch repair protein MutL
MPDIIQLLPDAIANQIAAGEVVQRPASAVKELLENAIDAEASSLSLVIKDAGKTLIQVIDNGTGMSETDTRLCLERHATSKIRKTEDLFCIRTMGFRGEAIASIAAIAQLEIKTRMRKQELGTCVVVNGGEFERQEACSTAVGTNVSVKNLFYNVPARRNFLKSTQVETKHIIEEFQRVALINPHIAFLFQHNGQEVMKLTAGSFRQRITAIYGSRYNERLVPVKEETDVVKLSGFISKPEFAKKTRGEQYFFVNNRFIKSSYLHHAVQNAYDELIQEKRYPSYFIQLDIDPKRIDINIHPTKTEVKFEEERIIYAIIRTAVKQALGKYNISPSLDFEQENSFSLPSSYRKEEIRVPEIQVDPTFNPFESKGSTSKPSFSSATKRMKSAGQQNWEVLYKEHERDGRLPSITDQDEDQEVTQQLIDPNWEENEQGHTEKAIMQLHGRYIVSQLKHGLLLIDQHRAHQRIIYENLLKKVEKKQNPGQRLLFPEVVELSATEYSMLESISDELKTVGFEINAFGKNTFSVAALPVGLEKENAKEVIDSILEEYQRNSGNLRFNSQESLLRSLSNKMAIPYHKQLSQAEMNNLIDELFACKMPYALPDGKTIVVTMKLDELNKKFQ